METYINNLLQWLSNLSTTLSIEVFVVVAAFLEEIIAPIPSPFVMTTVAILAESQGYGWGQLVFLVVLASVAKTISGYLLYIVVDKAEDTIVGRFGKYFGVSHEQLEKIGTILNKTWWDDVLLLLARALPFVPTSLVTIAAGVIKYSVRSFLIMTFLGIMIRNAFYLWVAYFGWSYFETIQSQLFGNPILLTTSGVAFLGLSILLLRTKDSLWKNVTRRKTKK